ncbi:cysteine--tRNA ligase [Candidatus Nomurabacteria bacterium]|nr:cysteine--tRNA ligase [Candidatus Nomurabacteria bacterium]
MKLYNTLTRQKDVLKPLNDKTVKVYTCGLTVYSHPQIGNWVAYIYSDVLHRALLAEGYQVNRVQNITDVGHLVSDDDGGEDKMEKGARAEGTTAWEVADKYIKICDEEAYTQLKLLRPNKLIRATSLIEEQINFVKVLEEMGYTYVIEDGVYFDTSKLDDYGKLAQLNIEGLEAGARVEIGGKKRLTDFALWKFSPKDKKRDMEWESPWGKGFPGWHLECSVIARENLGDQIDIHTGGIDHIPVHHTNEIAQTESLTGKKPFSQFWFHNNFIKVNGEKLGKSLKNSYLLGDIIKKGYSLHAFKLLVLSSHYRTEGNFTWEILEAAQNRLNRWQAIADLRWQVETEKPQIEEVDMAWGAILSPLEDDLNTPLALNHAESSLEQFTKAFPSWGKQDMDKLLDFIDKLLGINLAKPDISNVQKKLIIDRDVARAAKDWAKSDELRDQLKESGIEVKDTDNGSIWSRA